LGRVKLFAGLLEVKGGKEAEWEIGLREWWD
jgi:hypothetical protein